MSKQISPYLKLNTSPKLSEHIMATYRIESRLPLAMAAVKVAEESSIGTWTKLTTLDKKVIERLGPKIFYLNKNKRLAKIAYPLPLFEAGNIVQLLSALAGNIFSMKVINKLRLEDLQFAKKYINAYPGPALGIEGIRKILKIKDRPIIGSIIKPKVGLSAHKHARLAYNVWINGVDLVKDDENLTNMTFDHFAARVKEVIKMRKLAERKTGQIKVHVFNVSGPADIMMARAKLVKKMGGRVVMVDLVATGLDNVLYLRKQNLGLIIHGHRAGHSMFTKDPRHGMSMIVLAKLSRLCGIDELHTGTVVGKMEGDEEIVKKINQNLMEDWLGVNEESSDWSKIKPVLPVASGGLHPGLVPELIKILGKNIVINFGGGLHGHPDGSAAGARAAKQAVMAADQGIKLKDYAKSHQELKRALEYWE